MPPKYQGFYRYIPGGSSGAADVLARIRTGQPLDDYLEPQPVTRHEPKPKMTSKEEIWGGALAFDLPDTGTSPAIMPTPAYAIGQTVLFASLKQLTFLTERSLPPPRRVWLYQYSSCAAWVPEAYFEPIAQPAPFDDLDLIGDWIPQSFVPERKPEDHELPMAV